MNTKYGTKKGLVIISVATYATCRCILKEVSSTSESANSYYKTAKYYETLVNKYKELPEDSVLKSDVIKDKMTELSNIDMKQFLSINNEKIIEYVKNNKKLQKSN